MTACETSTDAARARLRISHALAAVAVLVVAVSGCGDRSAPAGQETDTGAAAKALADYYVSEKAGVPADQVPTATRAKLTDDLRRLQAAAAIGARQATPATTNAIELARLELLAHSAAESAGVYAAPTDAELQQAYHTYLQTLPASEFHAAHILVATESAASTVITKLQGGAEFAAVAKSDSADDSKGRGGDLGWIHPGHLPAAFFDALKSLKPGAYTPTPVHTPYGWHVIQLLETRAAEPPPFDQVKAQLATNLQQDRYQAFLEKSLKSAP